MAESNESVVAAISGRLSTVSRRGVLIGAGGVAAGVALGSLGSILRPATVQAASDDANSAIVKFHTMAPVTGAFVGPNGTPIRGIHGGGLPWALDAADGELSSDGRLRVRVKGLVLAGGAAIGTNPIPTFRAIVSFENAAPIFTDPVPASTAGDAEINTHIELPHPGFAPIIFVGPGTAPVWFAVTGNM
ncbi:MAG TPA: hypothetical protein VFU88_03360 [Ktedonobacterales bacterium]|nr:hypothetical protein [Ktedonobacterales bacterium]